MEYQEQFSRISYKSRVPFIGINIDFHIRSPLKVIISSDFNDRDQAIMHKVMKWVRHKDTYNMKSV